MTEYIKQLIDHMDQAVRHGSPETFHAAHILLPELESIDKSKIAENHRAGFIIALNHLKRLGENSNVLGFYDMWTQARQSVVKVLKDIDSDSEIAALQAATPSNIPPKADPTKVFVVHGRNMAARDAIFTFLRAIGLHPIEWSEAVLMTGKPSPFIGEILDAAFSHAQAVLVLMTPDDIAWLQPNFQLDSDPPHEKTPTPQARPNVLFEAGMSMGHFPDRTILVELGNLRPFSDIGGRLVVRLSNDSKRRHDLADRLSSAGCATNISGRDWYSAGDFDASLPIQPDNRKQQLPAKLGINDFSNDYLAQAQMSQALPRIAFHIVSGSMTHDGQIKNGICLSNVGSGTAVDIDLVMSEADKVVYAQKFKGITVDVPLSSEIVYPLPGTSDSNKVIRLVLHYKNILGSGFETEYTLDQWNSTIPVCTETYFGAPR